MLNRKVPVAACVCFLACAGAMAQTPTPPGTGFVFDLPGAGSASGAYQGYLFNANPLTAINPATGPTAATQIIAKPDGSKYYIVSPGGLQTVNPAFSTYKAVNGLSGVPCAASITPDGKFLFVGAATACTSTGSGVLYVLDTSTDTVVSNTVTVSGAIIGFAMSQDSQTAYMLTNMPFNATVTAISVSTRAATASLLLPSGQANSITISPLGLLYVGAGNVIYEIRTDAVSGSQCNDTFPGNNPPLCITPFGQILGITGVPGPLHITPSGNVIYLVNTTPQGGASLYQVNLLNRPNTPVAVWPPAGTPNPPTFSDVWVAGENEVFALNAAATELYDVSTTTFSAQPSQKLGAVLPISSVVSLALSNELPSARFLFALVAVQGAMPSLERVDLSNNTVTSSVVTTTSGGVLQFVPVPPTSGAASFFVYNNNQQISPGGTSAPLSAFVLDGTGRPIYNQGVSYASATPDSGITINNPSAASNSNGFVTATASIPPAATPGPYTVTVTAGTAVQSFTLTVPGNVNGGSTPQVTIVGGDDMLLQAFNLVPQQITILVTDANGKPLPNQAVTFTPQAGCGSTLVGTVQVTNNQTVTDENGLAAASISSFPPANFHSFQVTDINATTPVGSVDFCETSFAVPPDGISRIPQVAPLLNPGAVINIGEGDTLPNGLEFTVFSEAIPDYGVPIPFVGTSLLSTTPPIASCTDQAPSDNNGFSHCSIVASCQEGTYGINAVVGGEQYFSYTLAIGPGTGRKIAYASGNQQSGNAGSTLPVPLVAHVSDNCGKSVAGLAVTWTILQGSATLKSTVSTSDTSGNVSTLVALGSTPGAVKVSVTLGNSTPVVFNLTSVAVVSGISLVSGGGQTVTVGKAFAQPVVFVVKDANGNAVPNLLITFAVTSGIATVNPATAVTDTTGQVSTQVTAGATPGAVTITASYTTFSATANETTTPIGPTVSAANFYDAATVGSPNPRTGIVPCGLGSLVAQGIASGVQGVIPGNPLGIGPLGYSLSGFSMTINNVPVPLLAISNVNGVQQVNFQTPCETSVNSTATAVITINNNSTTVPGITVLAALPGIFTYAGPNNQPLGFVISVADGTYVTPSNPAKTGGAYYLVLTGLGQTTPPLKTDAAGTGSETIPLSTVIVGLDNAGIPVTLAEYAPGQIGVYVVGFQIPANAPTGPNQPLTVAVLVNGNYVFANPVYLPSVVAGP